MTELLLIASVFAQAAGDVTPQATGPGWIELARTLGGLMVVAALVVALGHMLKRGVQTDGTKRLRIEERLPVARGTQLIVVADGERRLLLSVGSDRGAQLITELDELNDAAQDDDRNQAQSFYERVNNTLGSMRSALRRSA